MVKELQREKAPELKITLFLMEQPSVRTFINPPVSTTNCELSPTFEP